ncbi:MAG: putative acyltransferase [Bacteroidetes bacterium]|nr:putative acyltransferase [Bacteroidota bacterium]
MSTKKIYFPGLNGIRFIAVFLVILDHLELFKSYFKLRTLWPESYSSHLGQLGVTVFFVLSGYLITYLLLEEKKETGINIKNFYIRRILRIWPLYFILMLLGFFILPHISFLTVPVYQDVSVNFWEKFMLFLFFLANVAFVYFPTVTFANVLWSVAVEEQFYLVWPNLVKRFKNIFAMLCACLLLYMLLKWILTFNIGGFGSHKLLKLLDRTRFSAMIIGGMGAWLIFKGKRSIIKLAYHPATQLLCYSFFLVLLLNVIRLPYFELIKSELTSVIVAVILVNISTNPSSLLKLENRYLDFLGKISYGMYIYHSIIAVICLKIFMLFYPSSTPAYLLWSAGLLLATCLLTVLVSQLSYTFIEQRILRMKRKYSSLETGDLVNER